MVNVWLHRIDYSFPIELSKFFDSLTVKAKIITVSDGFFNVCVDVIYK